MYIRKTEGPVLVRDFDGNMISRADLPPRDTVRWVARRKALVASAVVGGLISMAEACEMYDLSEEELEGWITSVSRHGPKALRVTTMQRYRGQEGE